MLLPAVPCGTNTVVLQARLRSLQAVCILLLHLPSGVLLVFQWNIQHEWSGNAVTHHLAMNLQQKQRMVTHLNDYRLYLCGDAASFILQQHVYQAG